MEYVILFLSACVSLIVNTAGQFRRRDVERILVFKLDHIGDVVTATPALAHLRRTYPQAKITLVVGPWSVPLLENHPDVDHLIAYASARYARGVRPSPGRNLRFLLAGRRYDLIVGLRDDLSTLGFSLFAGAMRRVDRGTVRLRWKLRSIAHRLSLGPEATPLHEVETNLRIVGGTHSAESRTHLEVREDALEWVDREIPGLLGNKQGFVVFHPGAFSPMRYWPHERFAEAARRVRDTRALGVLITGSSDEETACEAIAAKAGPGVVSLAGKTTLPQAVALIARARAMLSVDTGMMHIATAVGTPVVALVGPEDPGRFGPHGPGHEILYHHFDCSPCNQVRCERGRPECMEAITVEEVVEALARCLTKKDTRDP